MQNPRPAASTLLARIVLLIEKVDRRIVDDAVTDRAIEPNDAIDLAAQPGCNTVRKLHDRTRIAVDKASGCQQFCVIILKVRSKPA